MAATTMRTATGWLSLVYSAQAVVLAGVLLGTQRVVALPIDAGFVDGARAVTTSLGAVDLGWALVAILIGGAATHALAAAKAGPGEQPRTENPGMERAGVGRASALVVAGWSQGLGIVVFLVAQLNGISNPVALVPLFALSAGCVCLLGIDDGTAPRWRRPAAWAAVIGIVPWGVVALAQIGATITLGAPSSGVRIVTIAALVLAAVSWSIGWRRPHAARAADVAVMAAVLSVVVWAIVAFVILAPSHENG
ncbi:hypothetical protein [Herbiconiux liangxiaofengii]|uniref:hypothetical protein n=1 Tax=Herbiconiux liangxiaofengii TaxID=3342795 RepID=UPI0035B7217B